MSLAGSAPDPDLASLVRLADSYGLEYDLVLTLGGLCVEGTLVSARSFAAEVAGVVQGPDPDDTLRGTLAATFREHAEERGDAPSALADLDPESPSDGDLPALPEPAFVHLRDAVVSGRPGDPLPLWRGGLADVAGWSVSGFGTDLASD